MNKPYGGIIPLPRILLEEEYFCDPKMIKIAFCLFSKIRAVDLGTENERIIVIGNPHQIDLSPQRIASDTRLKLEDVNKKLEKLKAIGILDIVDQILIEAKNDF